MLKSTNKNFGIMLVFVCAVLAYKQNYLLFIPTTILLITTLLFPNILAPANKVWISLGENLQKFISPIILTLIYVLVIFPIGIFLQLIKTDFFKTKINSQDISYWRVDKELSQHSSMKNQF